LNTKPTLYVLAGVNGAGKSSVGGSFLRQAGLDWYNPDTFARELVELHGLSQLEANGRAWEEGMAQLDAAIAQRTPFAFETTLGGDTVREKIKRACATHDVRLWYCALSSPEQHVARVQFRAAQGGHDIPEGKIHERWKTSRANLLELLSELTEVSVFDNSAKADLGAVIPEPKLILHLKDKKLLHPKNIAAIANTPEWAQAIMERALEIALPRAAHH